MVITTTQKEHSMKHGHVTGHKRERKDASAWYRKIEAEWQAKQAASK